VTPPHEELARSAGRLWTGVLEAVNLRLELIALELGEERDRLGDMLLSALVVVFALFMLMLSVNLALLAIFWDTHRVGIAIASCAFYIVLAAVAAAYHRSRRRRRTRPFAATAAVLADDERALRELL
jgi:uncharacterized membrane protein YqjE